ncbi:M28 family peptidase [Fodinibius salsisoli]|uniref:M28 family peptidase n=1 Tax=Fodinibius salsisoli TaxID=2820877 RepID=A0ABT3PI32_9BACT|nr:M28 family peptidase [Fodinibius salsisoli]MCW9705590.1 M28 family peptidase [Fodinibius salsisoli]
MKMKIRIIVVGLLLSALGTGCSPTESTQQQEPTPSTDTDALITYQDEITVDFMRPRLTAFAADSMEGRETGMPGQKKAAEYLSGQYRQLGLQPAGDDGTYLQKFSLNASRRDSVVFKTFATKEGQKELISHSVASANSSAEYIRSFGGTDSLSGDIVFAGFGINDPDRGVNHLEGANLQGKWVLVFQQIPHTANGDTLVDPEIGNRARFNAIFSQGAEGILLIPDMDREAFQQSATGQRGEFGTPSNMRLAYREGDSGGFSKGYNILSPAMAAQLLHLDSEDALNSHRDTLIANISDFTPKELEFALTQIPYSSETEIQTENVLALLEGGDPQLKDEIIVMTSHYDHVGIGEPDSTGDRIYNGADDDGSGTIGLVNVAKAFSEAAENGVRPKRSILFLNVSGEEKGLLGSRYYSDHPVFPINKTIANLNTDMIGRIDKEHEQEGVEDYAYIIGSEIISSDLDSLIKEANSRSGQIALDKKYNDLQDPNQFYRRSDHWNFGRLGIPFAFFFTGIHEDYHRPSDEVHKIRFEKMAKIVRTMYTSAVLLANTEEPPAVDNQEFIEITKGD